jgi:uncharacterized DUF497 family protein
LDITIFEWDSRKDLENQRKHSVSFAEAQVAFADPQRIIAEDQNHSDTEWRYYCFGRVNEGILTVRFTTVEISLEYLVRVMAERKVNL